MHLQVVKGGLQELDFNQEFESIEDRMAQIRSFSRLSRSQQQTMIRGEFLDPLLIVDGIILEAYQIQEQIIRLKC